MRIKRRSEWTDDAAPALATAVRTRNVCHARTGRGALKLLFISESPRNHLLTVHKHGMTTIHAPAKEEDVKAHKEREYHLAG